MRSCGWGAGGGGLGGGDPDAFLGECNLTFFSPPKNTWRGRVKDALENSDKTDTPLLTEIDCSQNADDTTGAKSGSSLPSFAI